jgi:NAD(P)-dependent dehydrogenase (short-subunit alcohol dehydrogenase family)
VVAETATHTLPTPDDVARVIAFLCSTSAGCITGTALEVTAGAHLNTAW